MEKSRMGKVRYCLGVALLGLLAVACSSFTVQNTSTDQTAVVSVSLPDRSGPQVVTLKPGGSISPLLDSGGPFVVTVLPNEAYIQELQSVRDTASRLLTGGDVSPSNVATFNKWITQLGEKIKKVSESGVTCSGNIPEDGSGTANVNWDASALKWTLSCYAVKDSTSSPDGDAP